MTRGWGEKVSRAFSPFVALFRGLSPWRTVHLPGLSGGWPWNSGHVSWPLWDSDLTFVLSPVHAQRLRRVFLLAPSSA